MRHCSFIPAVLSAALLFAVAAPATAVDLTVAIENVGSASGAVRAALFVNPADFPGKPSQAQSVPAAPGRLAVTFRGLPPGRYAISAYHDINDNKRLDTGLFGRPTEPVGFSRDARGRMRPPAFDDAVIAVDGAAAAVTVPLRQ
jgi:uncharacterized protein (DUF2141 family)